MRKARRARHPGLYVAAFGGAGIAFCRGKLFDCPDRGIESAAVEAVAGLGGGPIPSGLLTMGYRRCRAI